MKQYFYLFLLLLIVDPLSGQKSFQPKQVDFDWKGIVYRKEQTGRFTLHTNGYSLAYNVGRILTYYKTGYYHFEIGYLCDPREQSQNRNIPLSFNKISQGFKYGKQNQLFVLRAGKGVKKLLTDKAKRKGVAVGYNYEIGPAIALLKPVFLELIYNLEVDGRTQFELRSEKYTESNADKFLDYNSIFGGAPASKGWSELGFVPGLQGKLAVFFSMGAYDEFAKSLELGIMGDLFIKKIPLMVESNTISNKPYFLNFYATIEFGKRSN
ncbi:MAG: hypothetical protein IPM42_11065 [Saprospiraceae bacterium]|nr:hypothetical protein [Saprospiraceae bacterium]